MSHSSFNEVLTGYESEKNVKGREERERKKELFQALDDVTVRKYHCPRA